MTEPTEETIPPRLADVGDTTVLRGLVYGMPECGTREVPVPAGTRIKLAASYLVDDGDPLARPPVRMFTAWAFDAQGRPTAICLDGLHRGLDFREPIPPIWTP